MTSRSFTKIFFLFVFILSTACQNPVKKMANEVRYSAYEFIGIEKRDLFKKDVQRVKGDQEKTGESYKDALEKLKDIYGLDGGNLEKQYRSLNSSYESAQKRSADVTTSIARLNTTANDLFAEWKNEIGQIGDAEMKKKSLAAREETLKKYQEFYAALKKSEKKMAPVLSRLKDQVLFLKHNLNAKAIAGLKTEAGKIQGDIELLLKDMNSSISQADEFMKSSL